MVAKLEVEYKLGNLDRLYSKYNFFTSLILTSMFVNNSLRVCVNAEYVTVIGYSSFRAKHGDSLMEMSAGTFTDTKAPDLAPIKRSDGYLKLLWQMEVRDKTELC